MDLENIARQTKEVYVSSLTFGMYARILDTEVNSLKTQVEGSNIDEDSGVVKDFSSNLNTLSGVMDVVASTLNSVAGLLVANLDEERRKKYQLEESQMEAVRQEAPTVAITKSSKNEDKDTSSPKDTISSILKQLLTNPLVIAGLTTALVQLLPADLRDNINAFFKGFYTKIKEIILNIKEFNIGTAAAGAALALLAGPKLLGWALGAITSTLRLLKVLGAGKLFTGKIGKMLLGGAAVAGLAYGASKIFGSSEESSTDTKPESNTGEQRQGWSEMKPIQRIAEKGGEVISGAMGSTVTKPDTTTIEPKAGEAGGSTRSFVSPGKNITGDKKYLRIMPGVDIDNLKPEVKGRLYSMARDYNEKTGKKLQVNSGFRSFEKQKDLYERLGPGMASRPGTSRHESGLAFDIQSSDAKKLVDLGLLQKYGFHRPYAKETWHIEPKEAITSLAGADNPMRPGDPIANVDKSGAPVIVSTGEKLVAAGREKISQVAALLPTSGKGKLSAPGEDINSMSVSNDSARISSTVVPAINTVNTTNKGRVSPDTTIQAIPSPSADRGSLNFRTSYHAD
jgi:hypothetical protein